MFILISMIACCLVHDEGSDLWPLLCLAKEILLLKQRFQFLITRLLSQPINWYTLVSIYLSSGYLMSLDMAHDPIPIFRPLFLTIASQNPTLLLLKKKGDFDFLAIVHPTLMLFLSMQVSFQLQRGMLLTLRHPGRFSIYFIWYLIPHVLWCDGDPTLGKFYKDLGGNSSAHFSHSYICCSQILVVPLFASSTLKNQSEEPFHISVSYL